jgi:hypothetical protein
MAGISYGWAVFSTDTSKLAEMFVWQGGDVLDFQRFPARRSRPADDVHFPRQELSVEAPPNHLPLVRAGNLWTH